MLPRSIQKRKNRVIYRKLFFSCVVFLISLTVCLTFFGWHSLQNDKMLSPLGSIPTITKTHEQEGVSIIKSFCEEQKIVCQDIEENDSTITITLDSQATILLSPQKDLQQQLASLQLTLSQLTIEGKQFKKLDFRFDKPFVMF